MFNCNYKGIYIRFAVKDSLVLLGTLIVSACPPLHLLTHQRFILDCTTVRIEDVILQEY